MFSSINNLFIGLLIVQSYFCFSDCRKILKNNKKTKFQKTSDSSYKCPENMYLMQIHKDKWFCECLPKYLYFSFDDTCHEAYRRGPCDIGNYFVLPKGDNEPKCLKNSCRTDGIVPYNNLCSHLKMTNGSCGLDYLNVNSTTFQLECTSNLVDPINRDGGNVKFPEFDLCPKGTRRNIHDECKEINSIKN